MTKFARRLTAKGFKKVNAYTFKKGRVQVVLMGFGEYFLYVNGRQMGGIEHGMTFINKACH
jgi:hypothetical protein